MSSSVSRGYINTGVKTASYSKLSVPGYTTIKYRKRAPVTNPASLKDELLEKEDKNASSSVGAKRLGDPIDSDVEPIAKKSKWEEEEETELGESLQVEINPLDRDDSDSEPKSGKDDDGSDSEDSSDDDDEELAEIQRQLERIKREKAEEKARKEKEEQEAVERERESRMAAGNPLMMGQDEDGGDGRVAVKKWYEETIFKNQAQGEQRYKKRVINDTVRNDFHKRFLAKYVQ